MRKKAVDVAKLVAEAHKRTQQLRRVLTRLDETVPEKHESWQDLLDDADAMERRLYGTLLTIIEVVRRDPAEYTRRPKRL